MNDNIELEIIKHVVGSERPFASINSLIQFILDLRDIYNRYDKSSPVRDVAVGKLHPDGHVVYSMEGGEN